MAQSCLEIVSMKERHVEIARNQYTSENPYEAGHPDATADGDTRGKGTGFGGVRHWLPDCTSYMGVSTFRYDDFDTNTSVEGGPGNKCDREMRRISLVRSKYSHETPYSKELISTRANQLEGQYTSENDILSMRTDNCHPLLATIAG